MRASSAQHERARQVLTENADKLEAVAQALEYETLDWEAFKIMEGETEEEAAEQSTGGTPSPVAEKASRRPVRVTKTPSALDLPLAPAPPDAD